MNLSDPGFRAVFEDSLLERGFGVGAILWRTGANTSFNMYADAYAHADADAYAHADADAHAHTTADAHTEETETFEEVSALAVVDSRADIETVASFTGLYWHGNEDADTIGPFDEMT